MNARPRLLATLICSGLSCAASGCFEDPAPSLDTDNAETGDGDGDPGDGDGDPGDGDGDPGDGDGDGDGDSGDGDGDSGDGDGDSGDGDGDGELVLFDLWALACGDVQWRASPDDFSGASEVVCNSGLSGQGAVTQHETLALEDGSMAMPALQIAPWTSNDGVISGLYLIDLAGTIAPTLRTEIACPDNAPSCDVYWQIWAKLDSDPNPVPPVLEDGFESYDGQTMALEIDLSGLSELTQVALVVTSNGGASSDDELVFVAPRIVEAP